MGLVRNFGTVAAVVFALSGCEGKNAPYTKPEGLVGGALTGAAIAAVSNEPTGTGALVVGTIGLLTGNRCSRETYDDLNTQVVEHDVVRCGGAAVGYERKEPRRRSVSDGPARF